ncbi:MAG: CBS domain-containing protein [Acidimicrobiales bacterium]
MQVSILLQGKGPEVVTIRPDDTVAEGVEVLTRHHIGAVVVSDDGVAVAGILSERDVVRSLSERGPAILDEPARSIMTAEVATCRLDTTVEELMSVMTERRIRHVPVVVDGELVGLISIGDVVKDRISALEDETKVLHDYIANPTY